MFKKILLKNLKSKTHIWDKEEFPVRFKKVSIFVFVWSDNKLEFIELQMLYA